MKVEYDQVRPPQDMSDSATCSVNLRHLDKDLLKELPQNMTIGEIRSFLPDYIIDEEVLRTGVSRESLVKCDPPKILTFRKKALNDADTLGRVISENPDLLSGRKLILHGAIRVSVTNKDFNQTTSVEIYNNMRLDEMRVLANRNLGDYAIDADALYEKVHFTPDSDVYDLSILNGDSFVLSSIPFDLRVRFNNQLHSVTVHKHMSTKQLRDKLASQFNLSTEFYIDIENGARLPLDNTRLHRLGLVDARSPNLAMTLQSSEMTQRLRYICQGCGSDVSIMSI